MAQDSALKTPDENNQSKRRALKSPWNYIIVSIGVFLVAFTMIGLTVYPVDSWILRATHLNLAAIIVYWLVPARKTSPKDRPSLVDILLSLLSIGIIAYLSINLNGLQYRVGFDPNTWDILFGLMQIILLMEMARRLMGWVLPILAVGAMAYAVYGNVLPGILGSRSFSFTTVVSSLFSQQGIYGLPLSASATLAIMFITFGAFLAASGAADFFIKFAFSLTGRSRGGPAKGAIVASSLLGMISGNAASNVATVGVFTIPLMKRTGYPAYFAGAVEAVASTGAQFMPPVMGTAAFIMSEMTGIPYADIIIAAIVPALLYYWAVYLMVDFEALSRGLHGLPKDELPKPIQTLKEGWHLLIPAAVLVYLLVIVGMSTTLAVIWSLACTVVISWLKKETRLNLTKIINATFEGARGVATVAAAAASAGIIIGVLSMTGLGLRFASIILIFQNNLFPVLFLTMLVCIVLGMGMSTAPSYIVAAAVAVPALVQIGVDPLRANLFVLFYACLSTITPPVCISAYTAAGIADASAMTVGAWAVRLGLAGFIVPYMFVFRPELLLRGDILQIVPSVLVALVGIYSLARAIQLGMIPLVTRVGHLAAAIALLGTNVAINVIGIVLFLICLLWSQRHLKQTLSINKTSVS